MLSSSQLDIASRYLEGLFTRSILERVWLPPLAIIVLVIGALVVSVLLSNPRKWSLAAKILLIVATVGMALYLSAVGYAYMTSMDAQDAANLGSIERYAGSGLLALLFTGIYFWAFGVQKPAERFRRPLVIGALILIGLLGLYSLPVLAREVRTNIQTSRSQEFRALHHELFDLVDFESDKVFVVLQNYYRWEYPSFLYFTRPLQINPFTSVPYTVGVDPTPEEPLYNIEGTAADWATYLADEGYDYVYVAFINEHFFTQYGSLFADPAAIANGVLFRVVTQNDGTTALVRVTD